MCTRASVALVVAVLSGIPGLAQVIYSGTPDWISADTQVSTGGALVDLDLDGWLDFVVSNGNDMAQQHVAVYYNRGDGTFPPTPDWQSSDFVFNGHLDVADVNGDGWPDVAVATLGEFNTTGPIARLYLNNEGTLSPTPDWSANVIGNAFGVAFGDMNNDGRPDLAVATGWAYSPPHHYPNYVYLNIDGTLAATPSWTSSDQYDYQGACWVDADADGWLDLAFAASGSVSRVYRNLGGVLGTTAAWQLTDQTSQDAIMVTAGDVTGDGRPDLLIADNNQISGGSGRFRQYNGQTLGFFGPTAAWTYADGYCSAVALADLDSDGRLDLATGAWWDYTRVFLNNGAGFGNAHTWRSNVTSVVEKIAFGDIEKNGLRPVETVFTPATGGQRLYHLPHRTIQEVTAVLVDGSPLAPSQYLVSRECGWLTIGVDPGAELRVAYTVSSKLDMAVTNWDSDRGNYVYYNRLFVLGDANCDGRLSFADINPFVMLLTGVYDQYFPDCDGRNFCDMNGDGEVNFGDINPFVNALAGS
ncbi:MAG: VCBS repeat-containing protein [Phycisphaerae bacterium]|nr:VCBS repeat-containing protein [Phycisphaerae bacterium]